MDYDWAKAKAAALKILGNKGDVPDESPDIIRARGPFKYSLDDFIKAQSAFLSEVRAMTLQNNSMRTALEQFLARIKKSNFGLNPTQDNLKKIEQVRKLLTDVLNDVVKDYVADNDKILVELNKVLNQMKVRFGVPSPVVIP